ncbi:MAG: porin [Gammaproteobacteria bacterium]
MRLVVVIFLGFVSLPALADEKFDAIWSRASLYSNPDNPVIQGFDLSGRAQAEWVNVDGDQGNYDDTLWRRFRFGFKAGLANDLVIHVEADFDFNEKIASSYERLTEAYIGWFPEKTVSLKVLKQSAGFTLDGFTSSKKLLTPERNNLTNNLWYTDEYFSGLTLQVEFAPGWTGKAGIFSSDGSAQISTLDAGYFTYLSAGYEFQPTAGIDRLSLHGFYVHNDEDDNAATPELSDVFSLIAQWQGGGWGVWADLSLGRGYGEQSDLMGVVVMPFYDFSTHHQVVTRYTWLISDDDNGVSLGNYENEIVTGKGDEYREIFVGYNWFFYGHKFKWQTGLQFAEMDDDDIGDGEYDGWGLTTAIRIYW